MSESTEVVDLSDPNIRTTTGWGMRIDGGVDPDTSTPWVQVSFQWYEDGSPNAEPSLYTLDTDRASELGLRLIAAAAIAGQSSLIHALHANMAVQGFTKEAEVVQDVLDFLQYPQEDVPEAEL